MVRATRMDSRAYCSAVTASFSLAAFIVMSTCSVLTGQGLGSVSMWNSMVLEDTPSDDGQMPTSAELD